MVYHPKISVITVCFNEIERIESTILSVVEQTYENIEFIVVDGNSNDGTRDILNKYKDKIDTYISEADDGIYDAMNKGVKYSTGDFLYFLNGGDKLFSPETICSIFSDLNLIEKVDVIYGNRYLMKKDGNLYYQTQPNSIDSIFLLINGTIYHQAAFISKNAFNKLGGYNLDYKIASDYDLFVRLKTKLNANFIYVNKTVCVFFSDGISYNPDYFKLNQAERNKIKDENFSWILVQLARYRNYLLKSKYIPFIHLLNAFASRLYRIFVSLR